MSKTNSAAIETRHLSNIEIASLERLLADQRSLWDRAYAARSSAAVADDMAAFDAACSDMARLDSAMAMTRTQLATRLA